MIEEWKVIASASDYAVSNLGRVMRVVSSGRFQKGTTLKPVKSGRRGYPSVVLSTAGGFKRFKIHRLVCEAFHGPAPEGKGDVAHFDGDVRNNTVSNLRWATRSENMADAVRHGTISPIRKTPRKGVKLSEDDVRFIRSVPGKFGVGADLARKYGVSQATISKIRRLEVWTLVR